MTVEDMHRLIKDLGYQPRQRDNWYQLVESRHAELASGEGKE
jgi:2-iminoacetate synthase ThiH